MDKKTFEKELKNRLGFTLEYHIKEDYSKNLHNILIDGIKKRIDNEQLTLFISSIKKEKDKCFYKFYIEISAKGVGNISTFDISGDINSNFKYRDTKERWFIIDQIIDEDSCFYSDPKIIINPLTKKRVSFEEHIIFLIKKTDLMDIGLTLLGLYPDEWLKDQDIIEKLVEKVKKEYLK